MAFGSLFNIILPDGSAVTIDSFKLLFFQFKVKLFNIILPAIGVLLFAKLILLWCSKIVPTAYIACDKSSLTTKSTDIYEVVAYACAAPNATTNPPAFFLESNTSLKMAPLKLRLLSGRTHRLRTRERVVCDDNHVFVEPIQKNARPIQKSMDRTKSPMPVHSTGILWQYIVPESYAST
jgi:hypothetical protein